MEITRYVDVAPGENPHGVDARMLYSHEHASVTVITLKPGESLRRHITPVDVFFYVLEGEGLVEIGDEAETVGIDTIVHSPAKMVHRWVNQSDAALRVLVAKTPRQKDKTILL
ncbi:cupin domain-containing protein [Candidatus Bathyarchaeota archaeon]|nr:cupin domain-containing protein [Candidatus Bathyarchaeota archaeon]